MTTQVIQTKPHEECRQEHDPEPGEAMRQISPPGPAPVLKPTDHAGPHQISTQHEEHDHRVVTDAKRGWRSRPLILIGSDRTNHPTLDHRAALNIPEEDIPR